MIWRIYKYTNTITGQSYIGQTTRNINVRAGNGKCYHEGAPFREDIDKYGWSNFEQSILRLCTSQEEADQYERHFIEKYNSVYPNGYNLESGGRSGNTSHNVSRQKMADSKKGIPRPLETKLKISDSQKGNTNTKGRKWFNDGTKNIMAYSCPEGFVPGRLKF